MKRTISLLIAICAAAAVSLAADAAAGQAVFDKSCKSCHGADGSGNPNIAKMMKVEMRPLGPRRFRRRATTISRRSSPTAKARCGRSPASPANRWTMWWLTSGR